MDKPGSIPVISIPLEEGIEIPGTLAIEPDKEYLSLRIFKDEAVLGFEAETPTITICDGEYLGSFTWGSSRITYWGMRRGNHICFPYNGNTDIICGNTPVFYIDRDFISQDETICRLLEYLKVLAGSKDLVIVESHESPPQILNNILRVKGRISEELITSVIRKLLSRRGLREEFIDGLTNILRTGYIDPYLLGKIVANLVNGKYSITNGIVLVGVGDGLYIGFKVRG